MPISSDAYAGMKAQRVHRLLIIEDGDADADLQLHSLQRAGIQCEARRVTTAAQFTRELADFVPDVVLCNDCSARQLKAMLATARRVAPGIPFLLVSDTIGEEAAMELLQRGASDLIPKGDLSRLPFGFRRAMRDMEERSLSRTRALQVERVAAIQRVLSGVNSAVFRSLERQELFGEALRIAVADGGFEAAWIAEAPLEAQSGAALAWEGLDSDRLGRIRGDLPDVAALETLAARERRAMTCNELPPGRTPASPQARDGAGAIRSLVALPLSLDAKVVALLVLCSDETGFFGEDEVRLLDILAADVSFAMEYLSKQEKLHYLAHYDAVTKSANRSLLRDTLSEAVASANRFSRKVGVLYIGIDHFKYINDSLGHNAGDQLLKIVADRLSACVRDGDTVARHGGDHFVIILPNQMSEERASQIVTRILAMISAPIHVDDRELSITCSIGLSFYPQDGQDGETLLKNAEAAMYRAKDIGRNTFQLYEKEMNARISERLSLANDLRRAVDRDELFLTYQPQIQLDTQQIIGAEALIRWRHPSRGVILPSAFIPLAEETGLIEQIGEWVLRAACAQAKTWHDTGLAPITIKVNISARQFRQHRLADVIAQILDETGLSAQYLGLELTESLVMHDAEEGILMLHRLKEMGTNISIDDFGTGYSNLSYLKRFPIDELKIDQSFMRDVCTDADDATIARAIIALAHGLGLGVTAEGVDMEEHVEFLRINGCDNAQGYFFSEPLLAADCAAFLRAHAPVVLVND
jgi:diguanylate cyclase (GGDEF)-like protein